MMDFETRVVRIEDARLPPPKRVYGEIVITAKRRRGQLIRAHVRAGGFLDAVIDTGSQITIGNTALRAKLFRAHPERFNKTTIVGVTGVPAELGIVTVEELQLGPVIFITCRSPLPTCRRSKSSASRTSPLCCSGPTFWRTSVGSRWTSAPERSASSFGDVKPIPS